MVMASQSAVPIGSSALSPLHPILRLSSSVSSLLRSTAHLPSLPCLIRELVYNAIDAGASSIQVFVDPYTDSVTCRDDGYGFYTEVLLGSSSSAVREQSLGVQRYVSTDGAALDQDARRNIQAKYGTRGEALASMAALGLVAIQTTLQGPPPLGGQKWTLLQRGERVIYSGLTSKWRDGIDCGQARWGDDRASLSSLAPAKGTEVTIRELYRDIPLRRPSRLSEAGHRSLLDTCYRVIQEVALREPSIDLTLKASSATGISTSLGSSLTRTILRCPKVSSLQERFLSTMTSVSANEVHSLSFTHVLHSKSVGAGGTTSVTLRCQGVFLLSPQISKTHQYVYVQGRRCPGDVMLGEFLGSMDGHFRMGATRSSLTHGVTDDLVVQSSPITVRSHRPRPASSRGYKDPGSLLEVIASTVAKGFAPCEESNLVRPDGPKRYDRKTTRNASPAFLLDLGLDSKGSPEGAVVDDHLVSTILAEEIERALQSRGLFKVSRRAVWHDPLATIATNTSSIRPKTMNTSIRSEKTTKGSQRPTTTGSVASHHLKTLPSVFPPMLKAGTGKATPGKGRRRDVTPDGYERYVDASTRKTFFVDKRTGNSHLACCTHPTEGDTEDERPSRECQRVAGVEQLRKRFKSSWQGEGRYLTTKDSVPVWLTQVLQQWENPALPMQVEEAIPSLNLLVSLGGEASDDAAFGPSLRGQLRVDLPNKAAVRTSPFFPAASSMAAPMSRRNGWDCHTDGATAKRQVMLPGADISKLSLCTAHVLGQVATKFILCIVPDARSTTVDVPRTDILVCIDQHAADERVRFESMLNEYVSACERSSADASHTLKKPVEVWLPRRKTRDLFLPGSIVSQALSFWGFGVVSGDTEVPTSETLDDHGEGLSDQHLVEAQGEVKIMVTHVPAPLSGRLKTEKATLQSVLLSFFDEDAPPLSLPPPSITTTTTTTISDADGNANNKGEMNQSSLSAIASPHHWTLALRHLPARLLDLFRSKACRGAIMFNDVLRYDQCTRLVHQLAMTTFPFQCAHGRRGLVPLCSLPRRRDDGEGELIQGRGTVLHRFVEGHSRGGGGRGEEERRSSTASIEPSLLRRRLQRRRVIDWGRVGQLNPHSSEAGAGAGAGAGGQDETMIEPRIREGPQGKG